MAERTQDRSPNSNAERGAGTALPLPMRTVATIAMCLVSLALAGIVASGIASIGHTEEHSDRQVPVATGDGPVTGDSDAISGIGDQLDVTVTFDGQGIDPNSLPLAERRPLPDKGLTGFMFAALDNGQRQLYADALFQMEAMNRMFLVEYDADQLPDGGRGKVLQAINAVIAEHPELFWMQSTGDGSPYVIQVREGVFFVGTFWNASEGEIDDIRSRIDDATNDYLVRIAGASSDYDKVLFTYDYVREICSYDHEDRYDPRHQSIQSLLLDGRSVCTGYAKTMSYLLRKVNVPCWYVDVECEPTESDLSDGVPLTGQGKVAHACDVVSIDGTWHYLDATFGDESPVPYSYMTMTSAELDAIGHSVVLEDTFPVCTDTSWDYYHVTGWTLSAATEDGIRDIIRKASERAWRQASVKCDSRRVYEGLMAVAGDEGLMTRIVAEETGEDEDAIGLSVESNPKCKTISIEW